MIIEIKQNLYKYENACLKIENDNIMVWRLFDAVEIKSIFSIVIFLIYNFL